MSEQLGLSERAIKGEFYRRLPVAMTTAWWNPLVAFASNSDQESEIFRMLGMTPMPREWTSERSQRGLPVFEIPIANKDWELTLRFNRWDWDNDKTGQIAVRVGEMPIRFAAHVSKLITTRLVNGTGATDGLAYDGQYFLDTDHVSGDSGTQKNVLTSSEVASLNVGTAAAPTQSEMALAILDSIAYAQGIKDDTGEPINEDANEWIVMGSTNLSGAMNAAVYNATLNTGTGVEANPLMSARGPNDGALSIRVVTNSRLATTDVFYLLRRDGSTRPFILSMAEQPKIEVIGPGSETTIMTKKVIVAGSAKYNVGYGQWEHAFKCTLS